MLHSFGSFQALSISISEINGPNNRMNKFFQQLPISKYRLLGFVIASSLILSKICQNPFYNRFPFFDCYFIFLTAEKFLQNRLLSVAFLQPIFFRFQKMGCFGFWRVSVIMYWNRLHERNATDFSFSVLKSGLTYLLLVYRSKRLWNNEFWIISSAAPWAEIYQKFAF